MLTCLRVFLEDVLIHSVAFPFREMILYSIQFYTQSLFNTVLFSSTEFTF